jgi:hypothetical protein
MRQIEIKKGTYKIPRERVRYIYIYIHICGSVQFVSDKKVIKAWGVRGDD